MIATLLKRCALLLTLVAGLPAVAQYVSLTGTLQSANGLVAANDSISLTPSQWFFVAGTGVIVNNAVFCATSVDGTVVGTGNPLQAPVLSVTYSGGLYAGNYYVEIAWYDAAGNVTLVSPEAVTQLSATGTLNVAVPSSGVPATAVGMRVYIGTSSGAEVYVGSTTGAGTYHQSTVITNLGTLPVSNTTVCKVVANDAGWPTGTGYQASMTDTSGNTLPGYPMMWQLLGANTTINLSSGLPYYHGIVMYPSPILASPQFHAAQSISGPLNLGGYALTGVGSINGGPASSYLVDASSFPGADECAKHNAALASLPASGGVVSDLGFSGVQVVSTTCQTALGGVNAWQPVLNLFNPGVTIVPASPTMTIVDWWANSQVTGLSIDASGTKGGASGFTGIEVLYPDNGGNAQLTTLANTLLIAPPGTGTLLSLQGGDAAWLVVNNVKGTGGLVGLNIVAGSCPYCFYNGNWFNNLAFTNTVTCLNLDGSAYPSPGQYDTAIAGNHFANVSCEHGAQSVTASALQNASQNFFDAFDVWDGGLTTWDANSADNWWSGIGAQSVTTQPGPRNNYRDTRTDSISSTGLHMEYHGGGIDFIGTKVAMQSATGQPMYTWQPGASCLGFASGGSIFTCLSGSQVASLAIKVNNVTLTAPTGTYGMVFPGAQGAIGTVMQNDGAGNLSWATNAGYVATLTTFAAGSDQISVPGLPVGTHCIAQPSNSIAAGLTGVYVPPTPFAGTVQVIHSATAGGTFSIFCGLQ